MNLLPLFFWVASVSCFSKEALKKRIDKYNWDVKCWGKENTWAGYAAQEKALKECGGVGGGTGATPTYSKLPVYQSANQLPISLLPSYQYATLPWTQHRYVLKISTVLFILQAGEATCNIFKRGQLSAGTCRFSGQLVWTEVVQSICHLGQQSCLIIPDLICTLKWETWLVS